MSSVNLASRGGRNGGNRGGRGGGFGRGRGDGGRGGGAGGGNYNSNANRSQQPFDANGNPRPQCQLCGKYGHVAAKCWKHFNKDYMGEEKVAAAVTHSYNVDPSWYIDTGATDHITSELDKLTFRERYNGHDQVHTASGSGMDIHHVGQSTIHTPCDKLVLKDILHVPNATKSPLSASKLAFNNNAFLEIHLFDFLFKERGTRRTILHGRGLHGLYPLQPRSSSALKQAFGVNKPSTSR
jgi:histone deacetylase 1/2